MTDRDPNGGDYRMFLADQEAPTMTDRTFVFMHPRSQAGVEILTGPDTTDVQVSEWDSVLTAVIAPNGDQVGIEFMPDGTMKFGTWDAEGMWVELSLVATSVNDLPSMLVTGTEVDLAAGPKVSGL